MNSPAKPASLLRLIKDSCIVSPGTSFGSIRDATIRSQCPPGLALRMSCPLVCGSELWTAFGLPDCRQTGTILTITTTTSILIAEAATGTTVPVSTTMAPMNMPICWSPILVNIFWLLLNSAMFTLLGGIVAQIFNGVMTDFYPCHCVKCAKEQRRAELATYAFLTDIGPYYIIVTLLGFARYTSPAAPSGSACS